MTEVPSANAALDAARISSGGFPDRSAATVPSDPPVKSKDAPPDDKSTEKGEDKGKTTPEPTPISVNELSTQIMKIAGKDNLPDALNDIRKTKSAVGTKGRKVTGLETENAELQLQLSKLTGQVETLTAISTGKTGNTKPADLPAVKALAEDLGAEPARVAAAVREVSGAAITALEAKVKALEGQPATDPNVKLRFHDMDMTAKYGESWAAYKPLAAAIANNTAQSLDNILEGQHSPPEVYYYAAVGKAAIDRASKGGSPGGENKQLSSGLGGAGSTGPAEEAPQTSDAKTLADAMNTAINDFKHPLL